MTLFEGNLPQKRERERARERERKRERERASWMPNDMGTAGNRAPQVRFCPFCECGQPYLFGLRQVSWTVVYGPRLSLLGGPYRFTVFRAHLWQKTPAILKWSSTITVTHMYELCMYIYIYMYIPFDYVQLRISAWSHRRKDHQEIKNG